MKQSSCCQRPSSLFLSNSYGQLYQTGCQAGLCKSREPFPLPVEFHCMVLCFPSPLRKLCFKSCAACRGLLELMGGTTGSHPPVPCVDRLLQDRLDNFMEEGERSNPAKVK